MVALCLYLLTHYRFSLENVVPMAQFLQSRVDELSISELPGPLIKMHISGFTPGPLILC